MLRTCFMAVFGMAILFQAAARGQEAKVPQIDPPKQIEGAVKKVDRDDAKTTYLIITVKERQPTAQEDMFREVDREHRFQVPSSIKIFGLDGKPDKRGLKSLKEGDRVRVEYRKDQALEIKQVPPRGEPGETHRRKPTQLMTIFPVNVACE